MQLIIPGRHLQCAGIAVGTAMKTGIISSDILALDAAAFWSLAFVLLGRHADTEHLPDIVIIDAFAWFNTVGR